MKFVVIAILVAFTAASFHPVNREFVDEIKKTATAWTPMEPEENPFAYKTLEEIKGMMGTKLRGRKELVDSTNIDLTDLPDSFDWRTEKPGAIHPIRDQANCGSCWAFASSEALSDRFAIESNLATDVVLSPQFQVSCDKINYGCQGGYLDRAWDFLEYKGTTSDECVPYTSGKTGRDGTCPDKCTNGDEFTFFKSKKYNHPTNEKAIMQEIQKYGPVEVGFMVYADFMSYKSGVYNTHGGRFLGGHAVKVIGWGVEGNLPYWTVANSWGESWGEQGFVKFRRGNNHCGIEGDVYAGEADWKKLISE
uniref:Peptidase C1A papain C-terminal domain-containing protein n=1 Tax=Euplotes harpa TaxID=151035 RepID=A0A7S3N996_9SPIT|mmetsp:Transcript_25933/g.29938  ORF Transcript_25933/g.29938 Transcript_25933/m.29938 type:complete len:307 (+) Transcript_25933:21-941(+)